MSQLSELCRAHVTRSKWVFVPTHAIGRTIGEHIALGGTNWLNPRFVTPLDIAPRMGAPFLVERGADSDEHVALVWEKALRHEGPVTLGPDIPATATRPGGALLGFCDWIETDFVLA
ncbi:MAG TPA: hypothetical protein VGF24_17685 [Vicinamibacterales bacterium]